jgi:DNA-binding MarR family transcriptional regulator
MTDVWQYSKAEGTRLLVLLALADAADRETRLAFPGIKRIGEYARVNKRQTLAHIKALIEMGELCRIKPARGQRRAEYEVLIGEKKGAVQATHDPESRVRSDVAVGCSPAQSRVQSSVDPIIEPSTEPSTEPPAPPTAGAGENGTTWMTPFMDLHLEILGGRMNAGKWVRTFRPLLNERGVIAVLSAQRTYLENLKAAGRQDFLDYNKMAESFGTWLAPQQKPGRPTRRIGGKDFDA